MVCLAPVLIMVSYNMSGWRTVKGILKNPKSDVTVLVVTFLLTVIFDLYDSHRDWLVARDCIILAPCDGEHTN